MKGSRLLTNFHAIEIDVVALGFVFTYDRWRDGAACLGTLDSTLLELMLVLGAHRTVSLLCHCRGRSTRKYFKMESWLW